MMDMAWRCAGETADVFEGRNKGWWREGDAAITWLLHGVYRREGDTSMRRTAHGVDGKTRGRRGDQSGRNTTADVQIG